MLCSQRVFPDRMPGFDPQAAPDDPVTLFLRWLEAAIEAGVEAPQAMTLATADERGQPSSRVLICKDVDGAGRWYFASSAASGKGRDLAVNPGAALSFWWPQQGRRIRIRGAAVPRPASRPARPTSWPGRPPPGRRPRWPSVRAARRPGRARPGLPRGARQVLAQPELVAPGWTLYTLTANQVEFWQGDHERRHIRLRYQRAGGAWTRQLLWP